MLQSAEPKFSEGKLLLRYKIHKKSNKVSKAKPVVKVKR